MYAPLLAWLVAAPSWAGEPILVPDFTPGTTSEFALAFMLQDRVVAGLTAGGHVVLTSAIVETDVGALDACADVATCPAEPLLHVPARVAVVVRVVRREGAIIADTALFERGVPTPVSTRTTVVEPGHEQRFVDELVGAVNELFSRIGPGTGDDLVAAARLVAEYRARQVDSPAVAPTPSEPQSGAPPQTGAPESADARHIVVDLRGGYAFGDVNRAADVRIVVDDGSTTSSWFQEGPVSSDGWRAALFLGYAPVPWMDAGVVVGLQYGSRSLTTAYSEGGGAYSEAAAASGTAAQLLTQPEMRFYALSNSPVKLYGVVGGELRFFDRYQILDPDGLDYPEPPGGIVPGALGGAGLRVDPGPLVGFFSEGTYTYHLGVRANAAESGTAPSERPAPPTASHQTLGIVGGVQFRL